MSVELLEILELYCELLLARIGLLEQQECDPGLEEPVKSLIYSANRAEVKELVVLRQMFAHKYGKQFESDALGNVDGKVNAKVITKLSVDPPPQDLVTRYLKEIARTYHVNWHSEDTSDEEEVGGNIAVKNQAGLEESENTLPDTPQKNAALVQVALPSPTSENPRPRLHIPIPPPPKEFPAFADRGNRARPEKKVTEAPDATDDVDDQSFDALMVRFEKLKRGT